MRVSAPWGPVPRDCQPVATIFSFLLLFFLKWPLYLWTGSADPLWRGSIVHERMCLAPNVTIDARAEETPGAA